MSGVIVVTDNRPDALARLDVFIGEWALEARFPGDPPAPADSAGGGGWEHDFAPHLPQGRLT